MVLLLSLISCHFVCEVAELKLTIKPSGRPIAILLALSSEYKLLLCAILVVCNWPLLAGERVLDLSLGIFLAESEGRLASLHPRKHIHSPLSILSVTLIS